MNYQDDKMAIVTALRTVARKCCCYISHIKPIDIERRTFCDCKYGINPDSPIYGEQSGCPDLNQAADMLEKMTAAQFRGLVRALMAPKRKTARRKAAKRNG